ncbi:MAG: thiol protease/hemagglutinin PrtT [Bacteroidales bacterium]|nr:thiol protease/hemagglutinin PrtT [Bacteroidales bacterium]
MKQKTLFAVLIFLMLCFNFAISSPITTNQAKKIAENKLIYLENKTHQIYFVQEVNDAKTIFYYVVNLKPQGFIIVSGDDELYPILAYSLTDNYLFTNDESINPLYNLLISDISTQLLNIDLISTESKNKRKTEWQFYLYDDLKSPNNKTFIQWPPQGTTSTGGWLETNWTQNSPYNAHCPIDPVTSARSIVGCPATAMGMILNYYQNLNGTTFTDADDYYHNYSGRQYNIDDDYETHDFLSFPEINIYFAEIEAKFENNELLTNDEKAALSFACGVAATQVFTSSGSGTFGVNQAYDAYQKFGFDDCILADDSNTELYSILAQNMKDGRPAHLAVVDGPPVTMGHNVVVDGYNTDNYFHVNFGWGGTYNSWYLIPEEIPYGLTTIEGVIMNIAYPKLNSEAEIYSFSFEEQTSSAVFSNDTIYIEVESEVDLSSIIPSFQLSLGATAEIESVQIISDTTVVDFSQGIVIIEVTSSDLNTTKEWYVNVSTLVSLKNNSNDFIIYPNPCSEYLTIIQQDTKKIEIINSYGQIIKTLEYPEYQTNINIEKNNFQPGLYFIKFTNSQSECVLKKFIVE